MKAVGTAVGLLLTVFFVVLAASADVTQSRDVEEFSAVAFSLPGELILIEGEAMAVSVTASEDLLEEVVTETQDGVLTIRHAAGMWTHNEDLHNVQVEVTFVDLDRLALSGSGAATAEKLELEDLKLLISGSATLQITALDAEHLSIAISGSGRVNVAALHAASLDSSISGSGTIEVAGHAEAQSISISGSGDHGARRLESQDVEVVVAGSGTAEVWANGTLDAVIAGSGDVIYRGDPEVTERIAGSGSVRHGKQDI
jgi:hypothetical protein